VTSLNYYVQTLLLTIGINTILAFSFYVPFSSGMICLGQAGFMAIGAYVAALLTTKAGFPFLWAVLAGGCAGGIVGIVTGFPALRIRGVYLMLMTLGLGEAIRVFFLNFEYVGGVTGISGIPQKTNLYNIYAFIAVLIILFLRLNSSQIGRIVEAIRENEEAAQGMGINLTRYKVLVFGAGAFIAGIGGGFYAHYVQFIEPGNFGIQQSLELMIYSIFGGTETLWGSIFGAAFLTLLPEWLRSLQEWRMFMYGIILLLMMVLRPTGIIDKRLMRAIAERLSFAGKKKSTLGTR
jgi:branched-chain amino acid transport system permease protein